MLESSGYSELQVHPATIPGITGLEASSSGASNLTANVGGLIIRIGFWGQLYYNYNKEPPE